MLDGFRSPAAALFLLTASCGGECREVPCPPSVVVDVASTMAETGSYEFVVVADGGEMRCSVVVPDSDEGTCSDDRLSFLRTGPEDGGLVGPALLLLGTYEDVGVSASRDGRGVAQTRFAPDYFPTAIEGRGCPVCPLASEVLEPE